MGKVPVRLKEVVYTLSPNQQTILNGLWKDLPQKAAHMASIVSALPALQLGLHMTTTCG